VKTSIFIALTLLLGACASQPLSSTAFAPSPSSTALVEQAAFAAQPSNAQAAPSESPASLEQVKTVDIEEIDNGRVCEQRKRPGSNMTQKFCYTRQEWLANQEAREKALADQLDDLQREQRWRDEAMRQAEMEQRRPSGFGFGPN
jgi:hypothetical protein